MKKKKNEKMRSIEEHNVRILRQSVSICKQVIIKELSARGDIANYSDEEITKICLQRMGLLQEVEKDKEEEYEDC